MRPTTPAGDTTRLSADPSEAGRSPCRAAIQWVYPTDALSLIEDEHVIGRDESCDTVLRSDDVSRRHAQLAVHGIVPSITDLQSRNGLYVNGVRETHLPIGPRDVIRIGGWLGVVVESRLAEHDAFRLVELFPGWFGGRELNARVQSTPDDFGRIYSRGSTESAWCSPRCATGVRTSCPYSSAL